MDKPCQFCGSPKRMIEADYYDSHGEIVKTPCCMAQKRNMDYAKVRNLSEEEINEIDKF